MRKYQLLSVNEPNSIYFRHLTFYIGENKRLVAKVPTSNLLRVLCHFRLLVRLLRLEVRCVEMLDETQMIFCILHKVWVLNTKTGDIKVLLESSNGFSDPIYFCRGGVQTVSIGVIMVLTLIVTL